MPWDDLAKAVSSKEAALLPSSPVAGGHGVDGELFERSMAFKWFRRPNHWLRRWCQVRCGEANSDLKLCASFFVLFPFTFLIDLS